LAAVDALEAFGVGAARRVAAALPDAAARRAGRALGRAAFALGVRRAVTRANVARAFGAEMGVAEREQLARRAYEHLGTSFVEFLRLSTATEAALRAGVELHGEPHLAAARAAGRGAIVASGHLGNWEVAGAGVAAHGHPVTFVVQRLRNPRVDALVTAIRGGAGVAIVDRGMGLRGVHRALADNRLVFIMCDQDARRRGVFVPFFGVPASTPTGGAQLALRLGVPFLQCFATRAADGRHHVHFLPPIAPPGGDSGRAGAEPDEDGAVRALLGEFTRRLEAAIRRAPEQYWWAHRRWKTKPPVAG
jgi:KDO2-lipid IV(A) lauroyltransferase